MVMCILDDLKMPLKKKETGIEKELVKVSKQVSDYRKKTGKYKIGKIQFLILTLYLLARLTLSLISASATIDCF